MNVKNLNLSVEELKILAENGQRDFIYGESGKKGTS